MHIVQALMRPINSFTLEEIDEAIMYIQRLIDSKRFSYDLTILTNRMHDLQERKEFEQCQ